VRDSSWYSTLDPRRNLLILPLRLRVVRMQSLRHKSALFPYFGGVARPKMAPSSVLSRRGLPSSRRPGPVRGNVIDRPVMFVDCVSPGRLDAQAGKQFPSTGRRRPVKRVLDVHVCVWSQTSHVEARRPPALDHIHI